MNIDRHELVGLLVLLSLMVATLAPIIEWAHAAFAYFEIMKRGFR